MTAAEFWLAWAVAIPVMLLTAGAGAAIGELHWRMDRSGRRGGIWIGFAIMIPYCIAVTAAVAFWIPWPS